MQHKKGKEKETSSLVATYSFRSFRSVAYNFLAACLSLVMHGNSSAESVLVTLSLDPYYSSVELNWPFIT